MSPGPGRWLFGRRPGRGSGGPPGAVPPGAGHRRRARAAPSGLRADLNLAPASVSGRLETLERRGFVLRTPATEDRRKVGIVLTEAGRAAWQEALDVVGREERRLPGVLSEEERRTLADLLRKVMLAQEGER
ncbi:MarR family winged helix-turn-helix transcriptional regulator [Kitasatospora sp. NPDC058048]|uniref:MarR family winged helix-turn-helix transcriptional regulator n=1 Tax=Kitasatospora sp. NPDC058048 TaxID=3346313 RepID=UPI0036DEAD21